MLRFLALWKEEHDGEVDETFQTFIKFENNKDEKLKMRKYSKFMPSYVHQGMVKK